MNTITITSISNFINLIDTFSETDFFRGQSSIDYKLIPSVGRLFKSGKEEILLQYERSIFKDFKRKYTMFTEVRPKNDQEFLFLAQHYGLPTRLLDWTYNPLIALFFACITNPYKDGVVFRAFPFSHKICNENCDILSFSETSILIPNLKDVRYKNQNGLFVLYPKPWEENNRYISSKYIIPFKYKPTILNQLHKIGINYSFIMPSLDSLSEDIKYNFKLKYQYAMKK